MVSLTLLNRYDRSLLKLCHIFRTEEMKRDKFSKIFGHVRRMPKQLGAHSHLNERKLALGIDAHVPKHIYAKESRR